MMGPHVFRCNLPPRRPGRRGAAPVHLATVGPDLNVNVKLTDIARILLKALDGRLADLLELAAFAYAADGAVGREGWSRDGGAEHWRRTFKLEVGVRDPAFWNSEKVSNLLRRIIGFLSDDTWGFSFHPLGSTPATQGYLDLGKGTPDEWPFSHPARVVMFSGGLDSLTGAAEMAERGESLLLVSHRSTPNLESRQAALLLQLRTVYPQVPIRRIGVWVNKAAAVGGREYTQRTRSFLFWAMGLAVGQSVQAGGVRFFENGVVSLNLPVADQVQGGRASRTTHPQVLSAMEELSALVAGRPFAVDNPYIFDTKADVVRRTLALRQPDLIRFTCSCTRTRIQRNQGWHCGCCSQCIDRRLACLTAGAAEHDPIMDYHVDVLEGARNEARDRTMAAAYARHAKLLSEMTPDDVAEKFNMHLSRAARAFDDVAEAARRLSEMHVRHGREAMGAIANWISSNPRRIAGGEVEPTSLVGMVLGREHLRPAWDRLATRLCEILDRGLPPLVQTKRPENEPRLQEMCDGLFNAANEVLVREFPFMRWGGRATKPDWSEAEARLWVELKYVRAKRDVLKVNEGIAADLTKYKDSGQHCLFITYDPDGHIVEREAFIMAITRHEGALAHIVR